METKYGDPFYAVATELVELAQRGQTKVKVSEALAALLLTWNRGYYRYHPELSRRLVHDLDELLARDKRVLTEFGNASIESFGRDNEDAVRAVFESFDAVLGPVGAAKALHLLAPRFFPLWDTAIAQAYGVGGARAARNAERYVLFMELPSRADAVRAAGR
jgi:hypothetical protein